MLRRTSTARLVAHSRSPPSVWASSLGMRRSISPRLKVRGQSSTATSSGAPFAPPVPGLPSAPRRTTSSTMSSRSSSAASRSSSSPIHTAPHSLAQTVASTFLTFLGSSPGWDSTTKASDPVRFHPPSSCCSRMRRHRREVVSHCLVAAMLPESKPTMRVNRRCSCMKSWAMPGTRQPRKWRAVAARRAFSSSYGSARWLAR